MFNKKKKQWFRPNPNAKKPDGPDSTQQTDAAPADVKPPVQNQGPNQPAIKDRPVPQQPQKPFQNREPRPFQNQQPQQGQGQNQRPRPAQPIPPRNPPQQNRGPQQNQQNSQNRAPNQPQQNQNQQNRGNNQSFPQNRNQPQGSGQNQPRGNFPQQNRNAGFNQNKFQNRGPQAGQQQNRGPSQNQNQPGNQKQPPAQKVMAPEKPYLSEKAAAFIAESRKEDLTGIPFPPEIQPSGPEPTTLTEPVNCPICNMPIRNQYTAMHQQNTSELVHFDCVLRELSKEHNAKLGRARKIYYIGAGSFAIVKELFDKRGQFKNYEIIEKINYEPREK